MSGWKTIFEDEIEQRLVTVKVYEGGQDEDESFALRVMVAPTDQNWQVLVAGTKSALDPITLEPSTLDDLEEELIEIGFTPQRQPPGPLVTLLRSLPSVSN